MAAVVASVSTGSASGANYTVAVPAGTVSGELLLAIGLADPDGTTWTAPAGWTAHAAGTLAGANGDVKVWWKVAGASEATYTWAGDANSARTTTILRITGANTTSPFDVTAVANDTVTTVSRAAPTVTATVAGLLVCGVGCHRSAGGTTNSTFTPPTGMTEQSDLRDSTTWEHASVATLQLAATGATGTKTFTISSATSAAGGGAAVSLVIKPAAAGGTTPVSKTVATTWRALARTTATKSTLWDVLVGVSASRSTSWRALVNAAATRSTSWNTKASTSTARSTTWRALASTTLARATSWNTKAAVTGTRSTSWRTLASAATSRATSWRVLSRSSKSLSTTWSVGGTLASVTKTVATSWRAFARTSATRSTTWHTKAGVSSSRSTTWRVLAGVTGSKATSWRVLARLTSTRSTTWRTRAAIAKSLSTSWSVASALATVTKTVVTTWRTLARPTRSTSTTWRTLARTTGSRSTSWDVLTSVTPRSLATSWRALGAVTPKTRSTSWRLLERISTATSLLWNVLLDTSGFRDVDVLSVTEVLRDVAITELAAREVGITEVALDPVVLSVAELPARDVAISGVTRPFTVSIAEGGVVELPTTGCEYYVLKIITAPQIDSWDASFDGGATWVTGEPVPDTPNTWRWLLAGPGFLIPDGLVATALVGLLVEIRPKVRGTDNPEVVVRNAPPVYLTS